MTIETTSELAKSARDSNCMKEYLGTSLISYEEIEIEEEGTKLQQKDHTFTTCMSILNQTCKHETKKNNSLSFCLCIIWKNMHKYAHI